MHKTDLMRRSALSLTLVDSIEGSQAAGGAAENNTKAWLGVKQKQKVLSERSS